MRQKNPVFTITLDTRTIQVLVPMVPIRRSLRSSYQNGDLQTLILDDVLHNLLRTLNVSLLNLNPGYMIDLLELS